MTNDKYKLTKLCWKGLKEKVLGVYSTLTEAENAASRSGIGKYVVRLGAADVSWIDVKYEDTLSLSFLTKNLLLYLLIMGVWLLFPLMLWLTQPYPDNMLGIVTLLIIEGLLAIPALVYIVYTPIVDGVKEVYSAAASLGFALPVIAIGCTVVLAVLSPFYLVVWTILFVKALPTIYI